MRNVLTAGILSMAAMGLPILSAEAQQRPYSYISIVATSDTHTVFSDSGEVRRLRDGRYQVTPGRAVMLSGDSVTDYPVMVVRANNACINEYYAELLRQHLQRFNQQGQCRGNAL